MSSETFTHQVPINGTIQSKVAPGIQTNLYYILVSNQLKDHVRTVCTVERVEVFNESTSGWVSVRGRENYDAALRLLNGGVFNGRALLADGKNATETIMIRELVDNSNTTGSSSRNTHTPRFKTPPSTQYSSSTPPLLSPVTGGYGEWASPITPSSSYAATSTMERAAYTMSVAVPYDYNEASSCYTYDTYDTSDGGYLDRSAMVSSPTVIQYPYESSYSQQYQVSDYQNSDYAMYNGMSAPESRTNGSSDGMIPTRQRKIIVKQLQPWTTFKQVQDLIRKKSGSDADKIQHIDLPLSESQESNRGYALITFQSEEVANKLIRRLNNYKYEGRVLRADYTKEGVSENETSRPRTITGHHKERREDRERKEKKESSSRMLSSSNDKKAKFYKPSVVIADGSSSSSSKRSDTKEKPSKRH
ncbi:hypothetical protein AAE478_003772 [Parahypoxylon ruwenzoriense]